MSIPNWRDFKNFFIGNNQTYSIQNKNGKWQAAIRKKVYKSLIETHLKKEITLGSYNIYRKHNRICCKWICIDIDLHGFKLENNIEFLNSNQINDIEFPIRLHKDRKKTEKNVYFVNAKQLLDYYWNKTGIIVYKQIQDNTLDNNGKIKEFWIDDVRYYYKEKYRIEGNDFDKLSELVIDIERFMIKFYNIPKNAICRERSGRGYHIWVNLKDLTTLKRAYDFAEDIKSKIMQFFGIKLDEVFPKQREIADTLKCPHCNKSFAVTIPIKEENVECIKCNKKFEFKQNIIKLGLGNFVKLPLSIHRGKNVECKILDKEFNLGNQEAFEITDIVKRIRKKEYGEKYYNPEETGLDLSKWKPADNIDSKTFFSKLRPCLKAIVEGKSATGGHGHAIRRCLANELFKLHAPLDVRIQAFAKQQDFDSEISKYQCIDLEMRARRNNRFYVSTCPKIEDWGFCLSDCPLRYRSNRKILDDDDLNLIFDQNIKNIGIRGGWEEARRVFRKKINGVHKSKEYIVKTTRSGTTTNIILESIENDKKILVIAPTIRICEITIRDALELTNKRVNLFRFGSNKDLCLTLLEKIVRIKSLSRFPFLLKDNCQECQFSQMVSCKKHNDFKKSCNDCRIVNKLRDKCAWRVALEDIDDYDIIYITTAKMHALTKTEDGDAKKILNKIFKIVDVIFLDEISSVLDVGNEGINFIAKPDPIYKALSHEVNFTRKFKYEYEMCKDFIENNLKRQEKKLWYSLYDFVKVVYQLHKNWKHLHTNNSFLKIDSPLYKAIRKSDLWYKKHKKRGSGDSDWLTLYKTLIEFTEDTDYYPRTIVEVLVLAKFPQFYLQYTNPIRYELKLDLLPAKPIKEFLDFLNNISEKKQFFCTDATEPPIDVQNLFQNITKLIINDPMSTAKLQTVYPDSKSVNISKIKSLRCYLEDICTYIDLHGNKNTMIICQNIIMSRIIRKVTQKGKHYDVLTYFRSPKTIGTPSDCRRIITIGSPYPPKNSHRWLADLFLKEHLVSENEFDVNSLTQRLEYYNAKSVFFQAISRGKDPHGKIPSEVYSYGLNKYQIIQLLNFPIAIPIIH